jgi:PAS domain S-box-containing protein
MTRDFKIDASVLDKLPCSLYIRDGNGKFLWCNKAQAIAIGLGGPEEVIGKTDFELLKDKEMADKIIENDRNVIASGHEQVLEESVEIINGVKLIVVSHKVPFYAEDGTPIGIIGASISMKAQKDQENSLRYTLDYIVSAMPGHIYFKDKNGAILFCNDKQAEYFGFETAKELIGKTDYDLYDKDTADKMRKNDLIVMEGKTEIIEEPISINNKSKIAISHKAPLRDPITQELRGVIGVSIDITKQKEAEEALAEKTQELAKTQELIRALEVKDNFLNNMSHEIRTPLQGIFGTLELLEDEAIWNNTPDLEKRRLFKNVLDARDRLMNLLSNLLDLSDYKKGRQALQFGYHDVKHLISDVAQEFQNITHSITMDVGADVNTYISCDDWRISQVIRNVLANAIKHGGQDRPIQINLDTYEEKNKKYLRIAIQDEGVGIPEDQLEEIFEPFTESNRTKRTSGGTGIGLAICKDIVAVHRGRIWAQNNVRSIGATFFITLPYEDHPKKSYSYRLT